MINSIRGNAGILILAGTIAAGSAVCNLGMKVCRANSSGNNVSAAVLLGDDRKVETESLLARAELPVDKLRAGHRRLIRYEDMIQRENETYERRNLMEEAAALERKMYDIIDESLKGELVFNRIDKSVCETYKRIFGRNSIDFDYRR